MNNIYKMKFYSLPAPKTPIVNKVALLRKYISEKNQRFENRDSRDKSASIIVDKPMNEVQLLRKYINFR